MRGRRTWRWSALAAAAGLALLGGCGGGNDMTAGGNAGSGAVAQSDSDTAAKEGGGQIAGPAGAPSVPSALSPQGAPVVSTRALIRTAELTVAVDDVAGQAQQAQQIAGDANGEVFSDQRTSGEEADRRTADLVLKIPPNSLGPVLDKLAKLGTEEARHTATDDVTEQVADVDSRVTSAKSSLARLRSLYARAGSIGEVAALESQISQRESELESLQARQRVLAAQTATATVTLHLHGRAVAAAGGSGNRPTGFVSALKAGWHAFALSVNWLVTVLGAILPFAVLFALLGYGAWRLERSRRTRGAATPAPAAPPTTTAG
jgi:hypothetical protein